MANLARGGTDAAPAILAANNVRKTYRTGDIEVDALRGIDLHIEPGEFLAVMGPSGCGKTTLLNCLSGLDDIDDGTVVVDGDDIHKMSDGKRTEHRATRMGFIFQSFNLIPVLTAAENVELPMLLTGAKAGVARQRAVEILGRVGLDHRANHRPNELSGGEQQRVAVARALVTEPSIVWADEPTGNLDSTMANAVLDLLREVHAAGQTIVIVTHDADIGASAQRMVRMQDGEIVSDKAQTANGGPAKRPARTTKATTKKAAAKKVTAKKSPATKKAAARKTAAAK